MLRIIAAILIALYGPAQAQLAGGLMFPGPGMSVGAPAYVGPGDVKSYANWGSCSFTYTAALATTSTPLCDLNAITGGAAVCTLRGSASGSVDQSAYCLGLLTPTAACAAAAGGGCTISKVYDQAGASGGWLQATNTARPQIVFSAINGIPAINCIRANSTLMTANNAAVNIPYGMAAVARRLSSFTSGQMIISNNTGAGSDTEFGFNGTADTASFYQGVQTTASALDSAAHVFQAVSNSPTNATINVDGATQVVGGVGANDIGSNSLTLCAFPSGVLFMDGYIGEAGVYSGTYSSGLQSNTRSRWGL